MSDSCPSASGASRCTHRAARQAPKLLFRLEGFFFLFSPSEVYYSSPEKTWEVFTWIKAFLMTRLTSSLHSATSGLWSSRLDEKARRWDRKYSAKVNEGTKCGIKQEGCCLIIVLPVSSLKVIAVIRDTALLKQMKRCCEKQVSLSLWAVNKDSNN